MIKDVEDDVDELPYSYFTKAAAIIFDKIYHENYRVLLSPKSVDLIETLGEGFHSEELVGHLQKVYPNGYGGLERFAFVRWYMDKEVSLDYAEDEEFLVVWYCKVILMDLQREIFLNIHAMEREWKHERLSLKEG